jgi:hypothetical protein
MNPSRGALVQIAGTGKRPVSVERLQAWSTAFHTAGASRPWTPGRPSPNCPLRMRCINSIPAIVIAALAKPFKPSIVAIRCFTPRQAAFGHHLHQVSLAQLEAKIPAHAHRMMTSRSKWRPSNSCSMPISLPMPTLPAARPTSFGPDPAVCTSALVASVKSLRQRSAPRRGGEGARRAPVAS